MGDTKYLCVAGETFDSVALIVYRHEKYACDLMNANPALVGVPRFTGGELLTLPDIKIVDNSNEKYMQTNAPWKI